MKEKYYWRSPFSLIQIDRYSIYIEPFLWLDSPYNFGHVVEFDSAALHDGKVLCGLIAKTEPRALNFQVLLSFSFFFFFLLRFL